MTPWLMKALRKPFLHNASVRYLNEFLTRAKRLNHTTNGFVLYRLDDVDIFIGMFHSFTQLHCSMWALNTCMALHTYMYVQYMHNIAHIHVCSLATERTSRA